MCNNPKVTNYKMFYFPLDKIRTLRNITATVESGKTFILHRIINILCLSSDFYILFRNGLLQFVYSLR